MSHVALLAVALTAPSGLERGIQLFNDFEEAKAEVVLREFLKQQPPPPPDQAAKAHLYLGLVGFTGLDSDKARKEFAEAVKIAPAIELPYGVSPKARLLFEQVQRETIEEEARAKAQLPPGQRQLVQIVQAPPPPPPPSRAPAYILGGIGIAGVAVGTVFGVLAETDLNNANTKTGNTFLQAQSLASRSGTEGLIADIGWAAGGALALTGIILFFVESPSSASAPAVAVAPIPQGAAVQIGGSF